jgi:endonuclease-3 related protein
MRDTGMRDIGRKLKVFYDRLYGAFGPQDWWPGDTPFEVAVGAILTQNTNWTNVEKAIANLKKARALRPSALHEMPEEELAALIRPAGYFNVKARRLKSFVGFLVRNFRGRMADMGREEAHELRKKLLSINGVGEETADSILLYALDKPVFVIDAYTKRILSRHGILSADDTYRRFREIFHSAFDGDARLFNEYHALLVRTGKEYCRPKKPSCGACPLGAYL